VQAEARRDRRDRRAAWLERWNAVAQPLLLAFALLSIPLAVADLVVRTRLPSADRALLGVADRVVWLAFTADLLVRASLLRRRRDLLRHDKSSIAIVVLGVPWFAVAGSFGFLRLLRPVLRIAAFGSEVVTEARFVVTRHPIAFVAYLTLFTWWAAGALVLCFEVEGDFHTIGDALWWSAVTMATVGYGDLAPATFGGRVVAIATMVVGIGSFSVVTAKLFDLFSHAHVEEAAPLSPLDRPV
jgi:voltage-gated potassium channel